MRSDACPSLSASNQSPVLDQLTTQLMSTPFNATFPECDLTKVRHDLVPQFTYSTAEDEQSMSRQADLEGTIVNLLLLSVRSVS